MHPSFFLKFGESGQDQKQSGASGIFPEPSLAGPVMAETQDCPENLQGTSSEQLHPGMTFESAGQRAESRMIWPRIPFSRLSAPGSKTTLKRSSFLSIPFCVRSSGQLMGFSDEGNSALYAGLSGSGSALFGLYRSEAHAAAAQQRLAGLQVAQPGLRSKA